MLYDVWRRRHFFWTSCIQTDAQSHLKGKLLGPSLTDSNCYDDIFLGNICQYQEYPICY